MRAVRLTLFGPLQPMLAMRKHGPSITQGGCMLGRCLLLQIHIEAVLA